MSELRATTVIVPSHHTDPSTGASVNVPTTRLRRTAPRPRAMEAAYDRGWAIGCRRGPVQASLHTCLVLVARSLAARLARLAHPVLALEESLAGRGEVALAKREERAAYHLLRAGVEYSLISSQFVPLCNTFNNLMLRTSMFSGKRLNE